MKAMKTIIVSIVLGIVLGIALAQSEGESILNGAVVCMNEHPMPTPCQNFSTYTCQSGCTWQNSYGQSGKTKCATLASGCCQWREETGRCVGACGTNCPEVTVPVSFTHFKPDWICQEFGVPGSGNYICRQVSP
jgi:hypothetical protein